MTDDKKNNTVLTFKRAKLQAMEFLSSAIRYLSSERDRFVLWAPVLLAIGIGLYFGLEHEPPMRLMLAVFGLLILCLYFRHPVARLVWVAATLIAIGFTSASLQTRFADAPMLYKTLYHREVQGTIDDMEFRQNGQKIILSDVTIEGVRPRTTPARISVTLRKTLPDLAVGDRVRLRAMLFPPPTPVMPGGYDYARGFFYDRIGAVGFSPKPPEIIEKGEPKGWERWLNQLRLALAQRIRAQMGEESGPVAAALMVGEESGVSEEVKDAMRDAGIYHVLSISGLHMSLAVGLVYFTTRFLLSLYMPFALRLPVKKIAASVGLLSAFCYLLLAGYPVPAVRSFIMVACVMVAVLLDRRGISLYSLAWAAILILVFHPESLVGASFQLSFAATLAIVALYERYADWFHAPGHGWRRRLGAYVIGLMATSLVASLATSPLVIYHFNRFTLWGIAANTLMMPLASFWIMPSAVLAFLLMPFGLEGPMLGIMDRGVVWMIEGARWVAAHPFADFALPSPTFGGFLLTVFGGLWLCLWQQRWRFFGIPAAIIGMMTVFLYQPYDLLISDDASKIAYRREDGEMVFIRGKPDGFDGEIWLRAHGLKTGFTLKDTEGSPGAPVCDAVHCSLTLAGKKIMVAKKKDSAGLCAGKPDMLITPGWLADGPSCAQVRWLIDQRFLAAAGAVGVRFSEGEAQIVTANDARGYRPWVARPRFKTSLEKESQKNESAAE